MNEYFYMGVIVGIILVNFIFPIFEVYLEVFNVKKAEVAARHQISTQMMSANFAREYPEFTNQEKFETHAIGFVQESDSEFCDEEECRNTIGFIK